MLDLLIFDVNAIVEDRCCKEDSLQELSVTDTIIQRIHRAVLVVTRAVIGGRITVYQPHSFKCGITRHENDRFFTRWNGVQKSLAFSIPIVKSNF